MAHSRTENAIRRSAHYRLRFRASYPPPCRAMMRGCDRQSLPTLCRAAASWSRSRWSLRPGAATGCFAGHTRELSGRDWSFPGRAANSGCRQPGTPSTRERDYQLQQISVALGLLDQTNVDPSTPEVWVKSRHVAKRSRPLKIGNGNVNVT
jgi:hypothetical protein